MKNNDKRLLCIYKVEAQAMNFSPFIVIFEAKKSDEGHIPKKFDQEGKDCCGQGACVSCYGFEAELISTREIASEEKKLAKYILDACESEEGAHTSVKKVWLKKMHSPSSADEDEDSEDENEESEDEEGVPKKAASSNSKKTKDEDSDEEEKPVKRSKKR